LLLAVANQQLHVADFLLHAKANMQHQNSFKMDALDYATVESLHTKIAKTVLSHCEYVIPQAIDGPYWAFSDKAINTLKESHVVVSSSRVGTLPDFGPEAKKTEYREEWLSNVSYLCGVVKKGYLMLNSEIGYLERDAVLIGALEMPLKHVFVYMPKTGDITSFSRARMSIWGPLIEERFLEASASGNLLAVLGLLKAKGNANTEDIEGKTALMYASEEGNPKVVNTLIRAGARVNLVNRDGYSCFLIAAVKGNEHAVRELLKARADLSQKSFKGNSVLNFIKHEGKKHILKAINDFFDEQGETVTVSRTGVRRN